MLLTLRQEVGPYQRCYIPLPKIVTDYKFEVKQKALHIVLFVNITQYVVFSNYTLDNAKILNLQLFHRFSLVHMPLHKYHHFCILLPKVLHIF